MKAVALTVLLCVLAPAVVSAQAGPSGFNPRFSASSAYPDQPDYRPPDRPRHQFDFMIDINGDGGADDGDGDWPDRPHHFPQRPRHRDRHR